VSGSRLIALTQADLFWRIARSIVVEAQIRLRKKDALSGVVDHDSSPDETIPGITARGARVSQWQISQYEEFLGLLMTE
jgi:hypothetical protein